MQGQLVDSIPHIQRHGVAVVVEVDDDFTAIPQDNPAFSRLHPRTNPERNWQHMMRAVRMADVVTVSTSALAAKLPRSVVLRNYIPKRYLTIDKDAVRGLRGIDERLRVGWTGTPMTHMSDMSVVSDAVLRAMQGTDAVWRGIGSAKTARLLGLEGPIDCEDIIWTPDIVNLYPQLVATLDVGIVPLAETTFNRAKSWLKGLEYAALGTPFVASPLPEYRDLARRGAGILAPKPKHWERFLRNLIVNDTVRTELAIAGRKAAAELTIEAHAWRWAEAWESATQRRKAA